MRFLGNIDNKKEAYKQARALAKQKGKTVVIEKAKRPPFPRSPKRIVTYRGWLDLKSKKADVINFKEWKKRKK